MSLAKRAGQMKKGTKQRNEIEAYLASYAVILPTVVAVVAVDRSTVVEQSQGLLIDRQLPLLVPSSICR